MPPRALLVVACLLLGGCTGDAPAPWDVSDLEIVANGNVITYPEPERRPAPEIGGDLLAREGTFDPSTLTGNVAVVNFWASWCGPCRKEQPWLQALHEEFSPKGVRFVGIDTRRDQRAAARAFLEEFGVTYPSIFDPKSQNAFRFRLRPMPATFVIDRAGKIAAFVAGGLSDEASLRSILEAEV